MQDVFRMHRDVHESDVLPQILDIPKVYPDRNVEFFLSFIITWMLMRLGNRHKYCSYFFLYLFWPKSEQLKFFYNRRFVALMQVQLLTFYDRKHSGLLSNAAFSIKGLENLEIG